MLEWFYGIYFAVIGGAAIAAAWESYHRERLRRQAFQDTAKLCGLRVVDPPRSGSARTKLEAEAGPVTVRVDAIQDRKRQYPIEVVVAFPGPPGFSGVRIRPEKDRPPGAREIEVGDERFDSAFFVEGPARLLTVLLDADVRELLLSVGSKGRLMIANGEIRVDMLDERFAPHLSLLLDLAWRFMEEVDVAQRLTENTRKDPVAGVRLRNLLVLVREFPGEPGTIEALRAACSDASPRVRLRAAMALGLDTHDVLVDVAESLEDDDSSAQAVAHLGRELPFARTGALLTKALRKRHHQTARACLESLGRSGEPAAIDALAKVLAVDKGEMAAAAALALGETGSPAAEPPLLQALRHEKPEIRIAAANALGRTGTAAAVLPLKDAAEEGAADLRRAIRQAIGEIQSRLQGASPGQLSLAGNEAGQLSMADAEAGQLSLATDPAGQLSLPPQEPERHGI